MTYGEVDYVIVGAGLFGSVFAQQMAEAGRTCMVIDRRQHVGGFCHSAPYQDTGIEVHTHGTHVFHTNDERIWNYVNRFATFVRYEHRVKVIGRDGGVYSMPINLATINQFCGTTAGPDEAQQMVKLAAERGAMEERDGLEGKALASIGRPLYDNFIRGYTLKQWGQDPERLPASIIARLPVRFNYDDRYFSDTYQGIPLEGYGTMFRRMLETGITLALGADFFDNPQGIARLARRKVVYTGPIDQYFAFCEGRLGWRSIRIETSLVSKPDFQGCAVMNYASASVPWTRIHEPTHLPQLGLRPRGVTVVQREYPIDGAADPAYPIRTDDNEAKLARYQALAARERNVIFGGRLAEFRYYDMHQVVGAAMAAVRRELTA